MAFSLLPVFTIDIAYLIAYIWGYTHTHIYTHISVQLSSIAQSCPTFCDPMNRSTPGLSVRHQLPVHSDSRPLSP